MNIELNSNRTITMTKLFFIWPTLLSAISIATAFADPASNPRRTPVVEVFAETHGAVVNISSTQIVKVRRSPFDFFFQDFDDFFQYRPTRKYKTTSVGSGFVIHESGYLITNAHVVARAVDIKVIFDDQRSFDAEIVAIDHEHDLALLRIDSPQKLPVVKLGRSDDLLVGESVIAIGNPLGYQHTLTTGVISATQRDLELINKKTGEPVIYSDLIQTDASINPGNSGGPLLNVLGELIGINTAIRGDAQNIGFAIPVNTLKEMLPPMLNSEQQNRFFLGVSIDDRRQVSEVQDNSPAKRAGLTAGDIITKVDRRPLKSHQDFYFEMIGHRPGDLVAFDIQRNGSERSVRVLLQERPRPDGARLALAKLGLKLETLSHRTASRLRLKTSTGLLIAEVEKGSQANRIGILPNDILTVLGRYYVADLDEIGQILDKTDTGDRIYVEILRPADNFIYRDGRYLTIR